MATRPVFAPNPHGRPLVRVIDVEFTWYPGFSAAQKQKSIEALHVAAQARGICRALEISGVSPDAYGRSLSAFNLRITLV